MIIKLPKIRHYLPPIVAILLASTSLIMVGRAASLTGGNHAPISISSDTDFTLPTASTGCQCVMEGRGSPSDPYIIGPWTIMATSSGPGVLINGSTLSKYFTLYHITVHGTHTNDGIDLVNVRGLGSNGKHLDSIKAANIDRAANGILIKNSAGVNITGNSINNNFYWGVELSGSSQVTVNFMTISHNGLSNPSSRQLPKSLDVFLMNSFAGGVLFQDSNNNVLSRSIFSEDGFAGFVLLRSNSNNVTDVHSRYPDYFGGVVQDSSNNTLKKISMKTGDFGGLLVRSGSHNEILDSTFSANGPIGNERSRGIVPYFIAGLYLGWGTHDNRIMNDHANGGDTGPGLVVDNGKIQNPVTFPVQKHNPFNNAAGNDLGHVPSTTLGDMFTSAFDPGVSTEAGSNFYCGNSFSDVSPSIPNPAC